MQVWHTRLLSNLGDNADQPDPPGEQTVVMLTTNVDVAPGLILPILLVLWFFGGMLRRARQRGFCNRLGSHRDRLANHRTERKKKFGQTMKRSLPYRLERVPRG